MYSIATRNLQKLAFFRTCFTLFGIVILSACGGGGGSSGNANPPSSQAMSPAAVGHLARFNEFRACANLGPLSFDDRLTVAAQAHADYLKANPSEFTLLTAHSETFGKPGFYGANITDRVERAGYKFELGTLHSETIVGGEPTTEQDGRSLADALLGSPAHRFTVMAQDFTQVGIAVSPLVSVFASPRLQAGNGIVMVPCEGLTGVNTLTRMEKAPFAVDETAINARPGAVGYPLSLSGRIFSMFRFRSPWLQAADGTRVPLKCASPETESVSAVLCASAAPLVPNSTYQWGVGVQAGVGVWNAYKARFTTGPY